MKSVSFVILNERTSGVEINALGLPPNSDSLASKSPKERET